MDWSPPAECATAWRDHVTFVIKHEKKHVDIVERALGDTNQRWVGRSFEACATTDERAKELVGKEFIEAVSADVDALQERIDREFMDLDNSEKLGDFDCSCHPKPPKVWEGQISGISGGERWSALVSLKLTREDDPVYDYELAKGKIRYSLDATDSFTGCEYKGESGEVEIPPSCAIFLHLFALEKLWIYDGGGQFEYEYMVHVKCPDYEADEPHRGSLHMVVHGADDPVAHGRRPRDAAGGQPRAVGMEPQGCWMTTRALQLKKSLVLITAPWDVA